MLSSFTPYESMSDTTIKPNISFLRSIIGSKNVKVLEFSFKLSDNILNFILNKSGFFFTLVFITKVDKGSITRIGKNIKLRIELSFACIFEYWSAYILRKVGISKGTYDSIKNLKIPFHTIEFSKDLTFLRYILLLIFGNFRIRVSI